MQTPLKKWIGSKWIRSHLDPIPCKQGLNLRKFTAPTGATGLERTELDQIAKDQSTIWNCLEQSGKSDPICSKDSLTINIPRGGNYSSMPKYEACIMNRPLTLCNKKIRPKGYVIRRNVAKSDVAPLFKMIFCR